MLCTSFLAGARNQHKLHCARIDFPINSYTVDTSFSNNASNIACIDSFLNAIAADTVSSLDSITVSGYASPDGNLRRNKELSLRRALATVNFLKRHCNLPDSVIRLGVNEVPWPVFRSLLADSDYPWRDEALRIASLGSDSDVTDNTRRMNRLKRLHGGKAWTIIKSEILPQLRSATAIDIVVSTKAPEVPEPTIAAEDSRANTRMAQSDPEPALPAQMTQSAASALSSWRLYTNAVEWGMLIANVGGEWDLHRHWSLNLSLHYSALDYFSSVRKFRTFILRPEARYWLRSADRGLFADAHLQMAAYNFALPGWEYRVQDTGGKHPALGGGVGIGYRLPLGRNGHWSVEGAIGCGIYHLKYDRFQNRRNGQLVDSRSRTWFGIDNAAVSIVYKFKTGGAR